MSDNNDIFTGTVEELLDHVTNNQDQLVEDAKASQEELQDLFVESIFIFLLQLVARSNSSIEVFLINPSSNSFDSSS